MICSRIKKYIFSIIQYGVHDSIHVCYVSTLHDLLLFYTMSLLDGHRMLCSFFLIWDFKMSTKSLLKCILLFFTCWFVTKILTWTSSNWEKSNLFDQVLFIWALTIFHPWRKMGIFWVLVHIVILIKCTIWEVSCHLLCQSQ